MSKKYGYGLFSPPPINSNRLRGLSLLLLSHHQEARTSKTFSKEESVGLPRRLRCLTATGPVLHRPFHSAKEWAATKQSRATAQTRVGQFSTPNTADGFKKASELREHMSRNYGPMLHTPQG